MKAGSNISLMVYAAGIVALFASMAGWGTYDAVAQTFTPHPIHLDKAVAIIALAVAVVRNFFGWARK